MNVHIKKELGNIGEQIAVEYLEKNNYQILKRNFYCRQGEIDIIAKDKKEIVFIEVKTRSNLKYGRPAEAVNTQKLQHMKLLYLFQDWLKFMDYRLMQIRHLLIKHCAIFQIMK